jgi:hypothetical protein
MNDKKMKKVKRLVYLILLINMVVFVSCEKDNPETPDDPDSVEKSDSCEIVSFVVDSVEWKIIGDTITCSYTSGDTASLFTPTITLSRGATVSPKSGVAQKLFAEQGVTYIVTAENSMTTKTYIAKAIIRVADFVLTGDTGDCTWTLTGTPPNYTLTISGKGNMKDYYKEINSPWYPYKENIKTLIIQDGVTSIGDRAFFDCSGLTDTLTIPNSVEFIGDEAFYDCSGLTSIINLNPKPQYINSSVFKGVNTSNCVLKVPRNSVRTYKGAEGWKYFEKIEAINVAGSVFTGITGDCTWTITGPSDNYTLTISGNGAMADYNYIDNPSPWDLYKDSIKTLVIQDGVTYIGNSAFFDCRSLTGELSIPNSVTSIGENAFISCIGLTGALTIPNLVTSIGSNAFNSCVGFTSIINLNPTPQNINANVFKGIYESNVLKVPAGSVSAYKDAEVWKYFKKIEAIQAADSVFIGETGNCTWTLTGSPDNYTLNQWGTKVLSDHLPQSDLFSPSFPNEGGNGLSFITKHSV